MYDGTGTPATDKISLSVLSWDRRPRLCIELVGKRHGCLSIRASRYDTNGTKIIRGIGEAIVERRHQRQCEL